MNCKACGGKLLLQKDFYLCENCGAKVSVSAFYEDVEVFLLCTDMDEQGRRTEGSLRAEELAAKLEGAKLKVFSSYRSAADLYGDDATLVSNAALKSAKTVLMLADSSDVFSNLLNENKELLEDKKIIPLFFGMEANKIPKELSAIQGIDIGKIGFEKDLIAGLYNLLDKKEEVIFKEKKNRLPLYLSLGIVGLFVLLASVFAFLYVKTDLFLPKKPVATEEAIPELTDEEKYQKSLSLWEEGKNADAAALFLELGTYEDCANRLLLFYSLYEGYYEIEDNSVRLHFSREGKDVTSTELIFVNENGNQLKILEASTLNGLGTSFEFIDSEGNEGTITLTFKNEGIELDIKTTVQTSKLYAKDQTLVFPLASRSDKSPTERITADVVLKWMKTGATYQDIIREGVELVFVDGITDGGATMHQATIYKIKDTEIQLCFPRYDTLSCTAKMITDGGFFGVQGSNEELPIEQCKLYSVIAPASFLAREKIGQNFEYASFWEDDTLLFIPNVRVPEYSSNAFKPPYWDGTSLCWSQYQNSYTLNQDTLVGVCSSKGMHMSVYEYAKKCLRGDQQNSNMPENPSTVNDSKSLYQLLEETAFSDWKQAYLHILEYTQGGYSGGALVYIDNDSIPELYLNGGTEATGDSVYSYKNGKVLAQQLNRTGGGRYIEKSGKLYNNNGIGGYYSTDVYQLDSNGFAKIFSASEEMVFSGDGTQTFQYYLNYETVSKTEYDNALNAVFNYAESKSFRDVKVSFEKIKEQLK